MMIMMIRKLTTSMTSKYEDGEEHLCRVRHG